MGLKKIEKYKIQDFDDIDISFETKDSSFHADFLGKHFTDKDINKLKSTLLEEAKSRRNITWKPVIIVTAGQWEWDRSVSGLGIELKYLGTIILPDGSVRQMLSDVNRKEMFKDRFDMDNWTPGYSQTLWKGDSKDTKLIEYTRERYDALVFMEERMMEFKLQLREVIIGDTCANFLDVVSGNKSTFLPDGFSQKRLMLAAQQEEKKE